MTENEVYERCIGHFKIVRRYADHVQCNCPAHSDKQASLTISKGRKCVLFHCHAGCTMESILLAVGIEKSDTFFESISNTSDWKKENESALRVETHTFLVTAIMLFIRYDRKESGYYMADWKMGVLHMDYQEIHQERA